MATIRKTSNNKFRVDIRKNQSNIKSKTFSTLKQAEAWGSEIDVQINKILSISPSKLKDISPAKIESYGGIEIFRKLGVEIELITFHELVKEYMNQWTGKDNNQIYRATYWQDIFKKKSI